MASHLGSYLEEHPRIQGLSWRQIGDLFKIGHETARQVVLGRRIPDDSTLERIAEALPGTTLKHLLKLRQLDRAGGPFKAPKEFDLLDPDERDVVLAVGHQMLVSSGKVQPKRDRKEVEPDTTDASVTRLPARQSDTPQRAKRAAYKPPTSGDTD